MIGMRSALRAAPVVMAVVVTSSVLAACGSSSEDGGSDGKVAAGYPVSVKSSLGTATIKDRPKRVVTLGWGSDDAALALGVKPVGMAITVQQAKDGITPWAREKLGNTKPVMLKTDSETLPYEKIADLHPDLILATQSGLTDKQYEKLSGFAPTIGFPGEPWQTPWQTQLRMAGKALGRSERAESLIKSVDAQVAKAASEHPEFKGKTAVFGSGTQPGSYNFYLPSDPRMALLGKLGFTVSDAATKTFKHGANSPAFATTISLETIPRLKADVLVAWYLAPQTKASIEKQAVFKNLAPVRNNAYVPISEPNLLFATSSPDVLTIPYMLDSYLPKLSQAAKNAA